MGTTQKGRPAPRRTTRLSGTDPFIQLIRARRGLDAKRFCPAAFWRQHQDIWFAACYAVQPRPVPPPLYVEPAPRSNRKPGAMIGIHRAFQWPRCVYVLGFDPDPPFRPRDFAAPFKAYTPARNTAISSQPDRQSFPCTTVEEARQFPRPKTAKRQIY